MSTPVAPLIQRLAQKYPRPECALHHANPFQLLVATILSAQCTDERVNQVTPALFDRFPTPADMAQADPGTLEELVRPTGFFRNKARHIRECSRQLVERHGGEIPRTMEELLELPGVARKTANVVLGNAFGIISGIVVDTHVRRVGFRLGLTESDQPGKIEEDLCRQIPRENWIDFSHWLIFHGRETCMARKPSCGNCLLADLCPRKGID